MGRLFIACILVGVAGCLSSPDRVDGPPHPDEPMITPDPHSPTATYAVRGEQVTVTVEDRDRSTRTYTLTTTAELRAPAPPDRRVRFAETSDQIRLRSGHDLFDALFALAIEEVRQNRVSTLSDGAFNHGQGMPCDCFETGQNWHYVWTRDTAYAVELALGLIDPARARRSLEFKLSARKASLGGGDLQIMQDTGSGGSYPISTDRVIWAIAAWETLKFLSGAERTAFRDRSYTAIVHTIEQDRSLIYDPRDGLYRGEQSFLDWREQSYPMWTHDDVVHLGMSKCLSTNVAHHAILSVAARLGLERGDPAAARYQTWADALARALVAALWLDEAGAFSAMKVTDLDPAPIHKRDTLGTALAVWCGVAPPALASAAVAGIPHTAMGPPVLWPQQPDVPIYHNRAIWPFVTAYTLLAARTVGNAAVFDHDLESLIRGAALNLSNMESFEFTTHAPWVDDGDLSGPVTNSRRQLWSVAGYLAAVLKGIFGLEATQEGIRLRPFVTHTLRHTWFAGTDEIVLQKLPYRGKHLDVTLSLPPLTHDPLAGGAYTLGSVRLNGTALDADTAYLSAETLAPTNVVHIELIAPIGPPGSLHLVSNDGDPQGWTAPREPTLTRLALDGDRLALEFDAQGEREVRFNIYRDGVEVASGLTETAWTDDRSGAHARKSWCYAVEAVSVRSGHASHHSRPLCWWGPSDERIREIDLYGWRRTGGGPWSETGGRPHFMDWGAPEDTLELAAFRPRWTGAHLLQLLYSNGAGGVSAGLVAGVKHITVTDLDSGAIKAHGAVLLPQNGRWDRWYESSPLPVDLDAARVYGVRVTDGVNMSYFEHFQAYTAGPGGGPDPWNIVDIAGLRVLPLAGVDHTSATMSAAPAVFDGHDDLAWFPPTHRRSPGARLAAWDQIALSWDDHALYLALATPAFEHHDRPWMVYLQSARHPLPAAEASPGMSHRDLTPALPFRPTHVITARAQSDDGSGFGPWNGVWIEAAPGEWVPQQRFRPNLDIWLAPDRHTLALQVPRIALDRPTHLRLAAHVVNDPPNQAWADTVPATHTPSSPSTTGYIELDLTADPARAPWPD